MAARNDLVAIPQLNNYSAEYAGDSYGLAQYVGDIAGKTGIAAAIALLRKFGSDAHLWLPGVGTLNGLTCGNYLESTGNTLLTVDNTAGLVLDALGSVGPELAPSITALGTGWINSATGSTSIVFSDGAITIITDGMSSGGAIFENAGVYNKTYEVIVTSTGTGQLKVVHGGPEIKVSTNTFRAIVVYGDTGTSFSLSRVVNQAANRVVTSFSVREVSGIHASQATTQNKPILRRGLTNLLTYSGDFTNASWSKIGSSVSASATTDPVGGTSASKIIASGTTNWHLVDQNAIPANTQVTFAVYAKAAEETKIALSDYSASVGCLFDLTAVTATVSGTDAALSISNPSIVSVGGGWYLCSVNMLATATKRAAIYVRQFATSYLGDGTSGVYVYRALLTPGTLTAQQILDAGGIPTTTTAAASNPAAGRYSWGFDGSNDSLMTSSAVAQTNEDHCLIVGATVPTAASTRTLASIGYEDAVGYRVAQLRFDSDNSVKCIWNDSSAVSVTDGVPLAAGVAVVVAARKVGATCIVRKDGATKATATGPTFAHTMTKATIGANGTNSESFIGPIGPVLAIKGTVTDAELLLLERFVAALTPNAPSF